MSSKLEVLADLFEEQRELNAQQSKIHQDLVLVNQKILYTLALQADRTGDAGTRTAIVSNGTGSKHLRSGHQRRSWFERGEAAKLIRRIAKRAMRPAEVVHAVMDAKGYSETLDAADKKRVQAALHQAVISAVKAGTLVRNTAGAVRVKA